RNVFQVILGGHHYRASSSSQICSSLSQVKTPWSMALMDKTKHVKRQRLDRICEAVEKELNKRVSSSVWVEYCCLLHYHRLLPLPPSSYSKYDQEERRRELREERQREGE
ncbi:hypothetical protein ILYODFUR_024520, partial [Ilyodon furcidens]